VIRRAWLRWADAPEEEEGEEEGKEEKKKRKNK
jgi:hypothetical protein